MRTGFPFRRRPATEVAWRCAAFERLCRQRGVRVTAQRLAVYRTLCADLAHPTADAVYGRVRPSMPTLSPATVYRILESLEGAGLIRRVSTTEGVTRFDANVEPHQHLVCRVCGRMTDHSLPALARAWIAPGSVPGFEIERLDVRVVGRCVSCRALRPGRARAVRRSARAPAVRATPTDRHHTRGGAPHA